jgi:Flp pilus assembly protein TadD
MNQQSVLAQAKTLQDAGEYAQSAALCREYLQQFPRDLEAIRLYARLAEQMDKSAEAIVIYRKLLAVAPHDTAALGALAWHHYRAEDYPAARELAERAAQVNPQLPEPVYTLGAIALTSGDEARAQKLLKRSISLGADEFFVDETIFEALLAKGRFEEAAARARGQIERWPENIRGYRNLAKACSFSEDSTDAALIRSLLDDRGELRETLIHSEEDEILACRALYKFESDLGNYASAWEFLERTKRLLRKAAPPDQLADAATQYDLTRQVFSGSFIRTRAAQACELDDPIFIVGMPRSGTTLLERLLASAPSISAAGERSEIDRLKEELCAHFGDDQYDLPALEKVPAAVWATVGQEYVKRVRSSRSHARHFVDKMPGNFINIGFITAALPKAKVIHLSRHPIANCLSIYEQHFGLRHAYNLDLKSLGEQYLSYAELMAYWRTLAPDSLIELSYEAMVSDPAGVAERLERELKVTLDLNSLAGSKSGGEIRTASYWQARQPVNQSSIARWTRYRDQLQPLIELLEPVLPKA